MVKTLVEAIVLVVIVMFVFLQNWRATLIPAIAVPVVLLGTFGVLAVFGFTINTLTLFGMVLAIGLLVDDAIVVVENVERVMREEPGITAREATMRSMGEIQPALIAHRARAVRGVPADGVLRRLGRRDLSPVLDHHRGRDGAVGDRGAVLSPALCAPFLQAVPSPGDVGAADSSAWFNRTFDRAATATSASSVSP